MPVFLTCGVILVVIFLKWALSFFPSLNLIERAELFTFDCRARAALSQAAPVNTNLAVIYVDDRSVDVINTWDPRLDWSWPRSVYGELIRELKAEGASVIGIDGFFIGEQHRPPDPDLSGLTSDQFLAREMAAAGNVVVPTTTYDIKAHPARLQPILEGIRSSAWRYGHDGLISLSTANADRLRCVTPYYRDPETGALLWQLGIMMAAHELGLDLDHPEFRKEGVVLKRKDGRPFLLPLDAKGQLFIDWTITPYRFLGLETPVASLYHDVLTRKAGNPTSEPLTNRVVLIGFTLAGYRAHDWGPTAVSDNMPRCLAHVNIANSLLTGRFIVPASPAVEILLIALLAVISAMMGWRLRVGWGLAAFAGVLAVYWLIAVKLYVANRYWLPVATPLGGSFLMGYVCLLSYRAVVERELRHVRSIMGKVLSPNIFNLLIRQPASALDTCRRDVTIYFADVRGFTRYMEDQHARTLKCLAVQKLSGHEADTLEAQRVAESLARINESLGEIADIVKAHDGTLDKYIGDCVMSFWGAPLPEPKHAVKAVQTAIAVHRALRAINLERVVENERRQKENIARATAGLPELEPQPVLRIGSGLNSGPSTVGFMGSLTHVSNYTVIGREVNIASRLEGMAEPDCILITEATFLEVQRHDPALAATCMKRDKVSLQGIATPVQVYEVPWKSEETEPRRHLTPAAASADKTSL